MYTRLRPFTEYDPVDLGSKLSAIVGNSQSRETLSRDFPAVPRLYRRRGTAASTVLDRQNQMALNSGFMAMAVVLGLEEADADVHGVTTLLQLDLPDGTPGVNLAIWLNPARPPWLHGVGADLLRLRLRLLLATPVFEGRVWTLIRPDNHAALRPWTTGWPEHGFTFKSLGLGDYWQIDGVSTPRLLMTSGRTLQELR